LGGPDPYDRLYDVGFHGDEHLIALADFLAGQVDVFVETGSGAGSTTRHMARNYPHLGVYSCEIDEEMFGLAKKGLAPYPNAEIFFQRSPDFLHWLQALGIYDRPVFFWLDAHREGWPWILPEEVGFLTEQARGYLLIDDMKVPARPEFQFSIYDGQPIAIEAIKPHLCPERQYQLFYPSYSGHDGYHPLVGTCLLTCDAPLRLPEFLAAEFAETELRGAQ